VHWGRKITLRTLNLFIITILVVIMLVTKKISFDGMNLKSKGNKIKDIRKKSLKNLH
jgi:hypothetical protein